MCIVSYFYPNHFVRQIVLWRKTTIVLFCSLKYIQCDANYNLKALRIPNQTYRYFNQMMCVWASLLCEQICLLFGSHFQSSRFVALKYRLLPKPMQQFQIHENLCMHVSKTEPNLAESWDVRPFRRLTKKPHYTKINTHLF